MKNFKKVLSLALALLMVVGCMVVAPVETKAATAVTYTQVESLEDIASGESYILVAYFNGKLYALTNDKVSGKDRMEAVELTLSDGTVSYAGDARIRWTIEKSGDAYLLKDMDNNYRKFKANGFGTDTTTAGEAVQWTLTMKEGTIDFKTTQATDDGPVDYYLSTNSNQGGWTIPQFGAYKLQGGTYAQHYCQSLYVFKLSSDEGNGAGSGSITLPEAGEGNDNGSGSGSGETATDLDVPANATQREIVELAYKLATGKKLTKNVTLTGVISEVEDFNTKYNSRTVTIVVDGMTDKPIECYGMTYYVGKTEEGSAALKSLQKGDTIIVTGELKNYGGKVEFNLPTYTLESDNLPDVPVVPENATYAEIVDIAYKLEGGQQLEGEYTLKGVVTEFKYEYSADYDNISLWIVVDGKKDKPIYCYKLKGTGIDKVQLGDTITVTGPIKNHQGTIEFNGCELGTLEIPNTGDNFLPMFLIVAAGCAIVAVGVIGKRKHA